MPQHFFFFSLPGIVCILGFYGSDTLAINQTMLLMGAILSWEWVCHGLTHGMEALKSGPFNWKYYSMSTLQVFKFSLPLAGLSLLLMRMAEKETAESLWLVAIGLSIGDLHGHANAFHKQEWTANWWMWFYALALVTAGIFF